MVALLQYVSLGLAVAATAFVLVLVLRRVSLAREENRRLAIEKRLRDTALALVDGDEVAMPELGRTEAAVFAGLLGRYSRQLQGEPREHIATYFEDGGFVAHEQRLLKARRGWKRAAAAAVLGDMASAKAIPSLLVALDDPERDVRASAARSLALLKATEAVQPLVEALAAGRIQRAVGGWALMQMGEAVVPQLRILLGSENADVRATAVELLGLTGSAVESKVLIERLRDPRAEVRAKAAHALGRLGAADAATALRETLSDRIFFVRAAAARALGQIGDRASSAALIHIAQTDRFESAQAAARALAELEPMGLEAVASVQAAKDHLREAAGLAGLS